MGPSHGIVSGKLDTPGINPQVQNGLGPNVSVSRKEGTPQNLLFPSLGCEICSPARSLTFSGLMENPLVGKKLKS